MAILVTGGAGFIGSNIVDGLIDKSYEVIVLDNLSTGKKENLNNHVTFYEMDIRDNNLEKVFEENKINFVIHQAAQIDVQHSIEDPRYDAQNNILGTINLLEMVRKYGVEKIIYASSAAVYGNPDYLPLDEKHSIKPMSPYGISKHTPEHYLDIYNKVYGLKYTILRYSNAYGPRQDAKGEGGVISIFVDRMLKRKSPIIYGDGEQTRDFIYVGDLVAANIASLENGNNEIFNISSNNKISINNIYKIINKILDTDLSPKYKEKRSGDIKHSILNNNKAKKILNWSPKFSLREGLAKTINYYANMRH